MNREARSRKAIRAKISLAAVAAIGLGLFSTLAMIRTQQTQAQVRAVTPDQQLTHLQNYLGYPFWDTSGSKVQPPSYVSSAPQTFSGGS